MRLDTYQAARAAYYRTLDERTLRHAHTTCCRALAQYFNCQDRAQQDAMQAHLDAMQAAAAYRGCTLQDAD